MNLVMPPAALSIFFQLLIRISNEDVNTGATEQPKSKKKYKQPVSGKSGKEAANDVPSWAKGERPYEDESGIDFAKRLMD